MHHHPFSGRALRLRAPLAALALAAALFTGAPIARAQAPSETDPPGKQAYDRACAVCHNAPAPGSRAAPLAQLRTTSPDQLRATLTTGIMAPMAAQLDQTELKALIDWLTADQKASAEGWVEAMMCPADKRAVDLSAPASYDRFGVDEKSSRNLPARKAGLKKTDMSRLELAWTVAFPKTNSLAASPVIVGRTMFIVAGGTGKVMALDTRTGCAKWSYDIGPARASLTYGTSDGRKVIFGSSSDGQVHAIDAATGKGLWKANGLPKEGEGLIRAAIVQTGDRLIIPISASGVISGMTASFECCTGHGAVVAISAKDGARLWEYHTMGPATYNGFVNSLGKKQRGPSGAPIWATPTIDVKRNRVLVTTGENTSHPATHTSDAVIALDLDTGKELWVFQAMESDVWNMACRGSLEASGPNCPWKFDNGTGRDFDFGGAAILAKGKSGRDVVLAGQKSGHVWALDAETGAKLWSHQIGVGTALGGVHWGIAADEKTVYAPISDPGYVADPEKNKARPGVYAFRIADGKPLWSFEPRPDCDGPRGKLIAGCQSRFGFSATPLVVAGALVAATLDGRIYVFDGANGKILFQYDVTTPVTPVNGVPGKGGAIDSHAIAAGDGAVFIQSGYGAFGQTPGNVLYAFRPKGK